MTMRNSINGPVDFPEFEIPANNSIESRNATKETVQDNPTTVTSLNPAEADTEDEKKERVCFTEEHIGEVSVEDKHLMHLKR